jgi:hypothetical protein
MVKSGFRHAHIRLLLVGLTPVVTGTRFVIQRMTVLGRELLQVSAVSGQPVLSPKLLCRQYTDLTDLLATESLGLL